MTALNEGRPLTDFKRPDAATLSRIDGG
jgi:hypothetical protein